MTNSSLIIFMPILITFLSQLCDGQESIVNVCFAKAFPTATTRLSCVEGLVIAPGRAELGRGEGGGCHDNTDITPSLPPASPSSPGDCHQATNVSTTCCGLSECHLTVTKVTLTSCNQPATFATIRYDCVTGDRIDCRQGEGYSLKPANGGQRSIGSEMKDEEAWPTRVAMIQSQVSSSHIIIGDLDLNMSPHLAQKPPPALQGSSTPPPDILYPSLSPPLSVHNHPDFESRSSIPSPAIVNATSHVTIDHHTIVSTATTSSLTHGKLMSDVTTFVPLVTSALLLLVAFFVAGRLIAKRSSCPCHMFFNYCTKLLPSQSRDIPAALPTTCSSSALATPDDAIVPVTHGSSSMSSFDICVNVSKAISQQDGTSSVRVTSCRQSTNFQTCFLGNATAPSGGDDAMMTSGAPRTPLLHSAPLAGAVGGRGDKPPVPKKTFAPLTLSLPPPEPQGRPGDRYTAENTTNANKDLNNTPSNTCKPYACTPVYIKDNNLV